jgi:two-component system sensor histidine kinase DesK
LNAVIKVMKREALGEHRGLGWSKYAWLAYLAFYFAYLVLTPATLRDWFLSTLAVAVFLPLYLRGFHRTGRPLLVIAASIYLLGAAVTPINPGAICFFVYAIAFVPFAGSPRLAVRWLSVMLAGILLQAWAFNWPPATWVPAFLVGAVVGGTNISFAERKRHGEQLRHAHEALEEMARVAERERIGRDLHDLLGHTLSVIVLKSELASKLAAHDPKRALEEIRDVERISRDALAEVRNAVRGYRSEGLDHETANAERVLTTAGVRPVLSLATVSLSPGEERALAFALREAVTNVVRHARARHCWITLSTADGRALLEVRDDGVGGDRPDGSGLAGMRDRLRELAGGLERDGTNGTRLRMSLPLGRVRAGTSS